jgi:molybdate transport system regulatory protein
MAAKSKRPDRKRFKALFRVYLGEEIALGPGKVELLGHIAESGSISEAARKMGMSYNRAWLLVRTMNRCFKEPLVNSSRGGEQHGGAQLTKSGNNVLRLYRNLETKIAGATEQPVREILSRLKG